MRVSPAVVVAVTACSLGATSCLELDRVDDLGAGDVRLVVEQDGAVVDNAVVRALSARVTVSDANGAAQLHALPVGQWPLVITVDDNDDGVADAAAIDARPVLNDVGTAVTSDFTGFDLGTVELVATGSLAGTAPSCAAEELCRVVVVRTVTDAEGAAFTMPVEASVGVVAGAWRIDGLAAGTVSVVTFAWDRGALQPLVAATRPTRFGVVEANVGDTGVVAVVDTAAAVATTTLAFRAAEGVLERASGEANYFVPTATTTATADGASSTIAQLSADAPSSSVQVPAGLLDVRVQLDIGVGALFNVVVVPDGAPLVAVTIGTSTCSVIDDGVDCNGDGNNDATDLDGSGTIDLADVDLDHNGAVDSADADLDHDGVADSTEPTACRVPGVGADRDADCLCDLVDPFPDCAGNDPLACDVVVPAVCE
jgi:hypothetical protein